MSSSSLKEKDIEASASLDEPQSGQVTDVYSRNADDALDFLRHEGTMREMTAADEKTLRRKIDWMIMPLMWSCYCLQYLDKTLINYANVMVYIYIYSRDLLLEKGGTICYIYIANNTSFSQGLQDDANLTKDQFSNLALIFYVSYLAFEFPHGYGMQRLPTSKYLGTMVMLWGTIVAVTSACKNFGALVATRVLLGVFEAAVAPSLILITAMWYKRSEQPARVGIWVSNLWGLQSFRSSSLPV